MFPRYDAANRVTTSSAGEAWQYDAAGNITWQKNRDGSSSSSSYNAENRATITVGVDKEGKSSTSFHTYDAVGNIVNTRVEGADYGFDEVTTRDVRYLEQSKVIANSWARGARGLDGASRFEYDVNGHLTFLDRGRKQGAKENSVGRSSKIVLAVSKDVYESGYRKLVSIDWARVNCYCNRFAGQTSRLCRS